MPLPRPMATRDPNLTPRRTPLLAGAPPTSASACLSDARTRTSPASPRAVGRRVFPLAPDAGRQLNGAY